MHIYILTLPNLYHFQLKVIWKALRKSPATIAQRMARMSPCSLVAARQTVCGCCMTGVMSTLSMSYGSVT